MFAVSHKNTSMKDGGVSIIPSKTYYDANESVIQLLYWEQSKKGQIDANIKLQQT